MTTKSDFFTDFFQFWKERNALLLIFFDWVSVGYCFYSELFRNFGLNLRTKLAALFPLGTNGIASGKKQALIIKSEDHGESTQF